MSRRSPAALPPLGLPGLDPAWSRLVAAPDAEGVLRTWHVLDTSTGGTGDGGTGDGGTETGATGTLLCVHGNPTWSYLWRHLLGAPPQGWRVVAVDQLGMGFSERPGAPRRLAQRIADLGGLTGALGLAGPVVTVAHDWGGPVSLGWALAHRDRLAGVILANTAVHLPEGSAAPALIRLARSRPLRRTVCERTPAFVRATAALSRPPLPADVRDALAAPYAGADRRRAVGDFVADIPLDPSHPSAAPLDAVTAGLDRLGDVPALLLWGPSDPVFSGPYLRDLLRRLPHASVHRYEGASHLVTEDRPEYAGSVARWVADVAARPSRPAPAGPPEPPGAPAPLWSAAAARAGDGAAAVVELAGGGIRRRVSWALLERRVREIAAGLAVAGVRPGERVGVLVPPGADLTAAVYACWRAGASIVVADAGLGLRGLGRALRGAGPDHVIGVPAGLLAARALRVPGRRIAAGPADRTTLRAAGASFSLAELARLGRAAGARPRDEHDPDAEAAVVFTSGATGPPKGVVYRHRQLQAQREVLRATYGITGDDRFVAAFAPFALFGPALGIASAVPDMAVTTPSTLTAGALADAVAAVDATIVFASPAALRSVVSTEADLDAAGRRALAAPRLVLSAGAPVPAPLLRAVTRLLSGAEAHTPYGMTEALLVADATLEQVEAAGPGEGVCVGTPVPGAVVGVSPLRHDGRAGDPPSAQPGVTGELCVRAAHVKDRYDRLWATEAASSRDSGWHRTGDVGHLDGDGRIWVEGRLVHVIATAAGAVTPVGPERRIEDIGGLGAAAVVGVGPAGTQQVVAVVVPDAPPRGGGLADLSLTGAVRAAAGIPVAAVLVAPRLPVDIRHASKVDRARVAGWASAVLAGGRAGRL